MKSITTMAQWRISCIIAIATVFTTIQTATASSNSSIKHPQQKIGVYPIFITPSDGKFHAVCKIDSNQDRLVVDGNGSKLNITVTYRDGKQTVNEDDTAPYQSQELVLCDLNSNGKTELLDFERDPSNKDTFLEIFANQGKDNFTSVTGLDLHSTSSLVPKFILNAIVIGNKTYQFNGNVLKANRKAVGIVTTEPSTFNSQNNGSSSNPKGYSSSKNHPQTMDLGDFLESFNTEAMGHSAPFMISDNDGVASGTEFTVQLTPNVMLDITYGLLTDDISSIQMLGSFENSNASADLADCMDVLISVLAPNESYQERRAVANSLFKAGEPLPDISNKVVLNGYTFYMKGEPHGLILLIYPNK